MPIPKKIKFYIFFFSFIFISLYFLMFSFQGFDLTDTGFHLTNQMIAYNYHTHPFSAVFLTDYIGGLWLSFSPVDNWLWWGYLGGVLIHGLSAGMGAMILYSFSGNPIISCLGIITGFIALPFLTSITVIIHYYTFPMFLSFLWILVFTKYLKNHSAIYIIALGILNAVLFFAALNKILLVCVFPTIVCLSYYLQGKEEKEIYRYAVPIAVVTGLYLFLDLRTIWFLPAIFCIILAYFLKIRYKIFDIIKIYGKKIFQEISWWVLGILTGTSSILLFYYFIDAKIYSDHRIVTSNRLLIEWIYVIIREYLYYCFFFILFYRIIFCKHVKLFLSKYINLVAILFSIGIASYAFWGVYQYQIEPSVLYWFLAHEYFSLIFFFFIFLFIAIKNYKNFFSIEHKLVILSSTIICLLFPMGSDLQKIKAIYIMPLILGFFLDYLYALYQKNKRIKVFFILIPVLWINGILLSSFTTFRDDVRYKLTSAFQSRQLKFTHSSEIRIKVVDELLSELAKYKKPGDKLLAENSCCTIYYLTGTIPWIGNPWSFLYYPLEEYKKRFQEKELEYGKPDIILLSHRRSDTFTWPYVHEVERKKFSEFSHKIENYNFLIQYIERNHYNIILQNEMFSLYAHPTISDKS